MVDVLAIAAHPDDVEQTCGGTLIRMARMGYRTGIIDLTAGEMGSRGTPMIRLQEARAAAEAMDVSERVNMGFPDARLENSTQAREALAGEIRRLRPRLVILPYWEGRHPDHYKASVLGYEACFFSGLKKLASEGQPHRPFKILYASLYANVQPSFVTDITDAFEDRMKALLSYGSQYGRSDAAEALFPEEAEIRERLAGVGRFYGNLIGTRFGEPFVVKEAMRVDDPMTLGVRSI